MSITKSAQTTTAGARELSERARAHLWMHFAKLGDRQPPMVIVRGDGCHVWDADGNRYLDALAALFCVNVGYGRSKLARAAERQLEELPFFTVWGVAHPPAIQLSARIAELAPGALNRVFFTSGGSEAVESAFKLVRNYHLLQGEPRRTKVIARETAYHGTSLGALAATGIPALRAPFEPLTPGTSHVPNTNGYRVTGDRGALWAADAIEDRILFEQPETVAAVILEPVQNAGGCLTPPDGYFQRVREICDRHGVLLISDEVICSWGRLGHWFGCERYGYEPDLITTAKGITSAYLPMGAVIASDRVAEPFLAAGASFAHGFTFGGHPAAAAVALANIEILEDEDLCGWVRNQESGLRGMLEGLRDIPIVGDVRGAGYFYAVELVADQNTRARFSPQDAQALVDWLGPAMRERGLLARADRRGDPVIQISPPLVAGAAQFAAIEAVLRPVLEIAAKEAPR